MVTSDISFSKFFFSQIYSFSYKFYFKSNVFFRSLRLIFFPLVFRFSLLEYLPLITENKTKKNCIYDNLFICREKEKKICYKIIFLDFCCFRENMNNISCNWSKKNYVAKKYFFVVYWIIVWVNEKKIIL